LRGYQGSALNNVATPLINVVPRSLQSIKTTSDSGYASLPLNTENHNSHSIQTEHGVECEGIRKDSSSKIQEASAMHPQSQEDCDDTRSNYSITSSMANMIMHNDVFISEFVEDIAKSLPNASEKSNHTVRERLYSDLPNLLRSFAKKVGCLSERKGSRDVMVYVSKNRW
jgi:hypothetical protein